jgi:glycosyltransferase involved in cell wall biosynthesis
MPATIIEAGLCGVPVITTAVGAIPEMVVDGETGVVLGTDRIDELASVVRALLAEPSRSRRLGAAARARCLANYGIEPVAAEYETVLFEALAR